jgi:hypothetical protein
MVPIRRYARCSKAYSLTAAERSKTGTGHYRSGTPTTAFSGAWEVADVPGADLSRSARAALHEHSHVISEWMLADRSLDFRDGLHWLIVYLQEALSTLDVGDG